MSDRKYAKYLFFSLDEVFYDVYISPTVEITAHVTKIMRLSLQENILCYNGKPVKSFSLEEGIIQLIDFLKKFETPVTLVAHNYRAFDVFYLIQSINSVKMLNKYRKLSKASSTPYPS